MLSKTCRVELTLVPVPLPEDRKAAYWQAIGIIADLIRLRLLNEKGILESETAFGDRAEQALKGISTGEDAQVQMVARDCLV
jgi:hypothetical protein